MRVGWRRRPRRVASVRRALWRRTHHSLRAAHGSAYMTSGFRRVLDATASRLRVFFVRRLSVKVRASERPNYLRTWRLR